MRKNKDIPPLAANTQHVYERHALRFDSERVKTLFERKWLSRLEAALPNPATILDAGCGAGEPIAKYFIQNGHELVGIDYAAAMIALAKKRFPGGQWKVADMRTLDLPVFFDGIVGWHSFFHLTPGEQRSTLGRFARHLKPGGMLLLTVGPAAGEVTGYVGDEAVYHSSLSQPAYRQILQNLGLEIIDFAVEDPECDFATILLAQKEK